MLKTLLKYEWKDTWLLCATCNGIALVLSLIGAAILVMGVNSFSGHQSDTAQAFMGMGMAFYYVIYFMSVLGVAFVMRYFFFYRYYKNLFTDQGYLMHTLPVNTVDLLNAKLIIAIVWQYITAIVIGVCVVVLIGSFTVSLGDFTMKDLMDNLRDLDEIYFDYYKTIPAVASGILIALVTPIIEVLLMYMAVGLGQQSKKNRFFISIVILIGIYIGKRFVVSIITFPLQMIFINNEPSIAGVNVGFVMAALCSCGLAVGLYFLNKYLIEKKLNLE